MALDTSKGPEKTLTFPTRQALADLKHQMAGPANRQRTLHHFHPSAQVFLSAEWPLQVSSLQRDPQRHKTPQSPKTQIKRPTEDFPHSSLSQP